jgi:tetratricopeptide (TPR) repeat protein
MFMVLLRLALAGSLLLAAPSCGGETIVKTVKNDKKKNAKQLVTDARNQASAGKIDDADRSYGEAYANADEAPKLAWDILEEWVGFLAHAGRPSRAHDVAKQYFDANQEDLKGYHLYAEACLAGNRGQEAFTITGQLVELDNDNPNTHDQRGRALILLERTEEGIEELRKAVQLDSATAKYHMSLGTALLKINDPNKAALEFRAALKAAPNDPEVHVMLGAALRDQEEFDESRSYLDKALEIDPKNGRAYFELGRLYNRLRKQAEAETAFGKAVKYSPNDSLFWYAYGEIYRVQNRNDEAIAAYQRALAIDPPYAKATGKLGCTLVDTKQYDDAEPYLIQAIRKETKNAQNYWCLGNAYAAKRKYRAAIDNYELFLKYASKDDNDRERARELINQLKRK